MKLSIIIPVFNEQENLRALHQADCAHRADNGLHCLRPRKHKRLHARIASVWGDDGKSRLVSSADNDA
jgi:hypothetical protein